MSLLRIHSDLMLLKKTGSNNKKVEILTERLKDSKFREVIILMYDDKYHFNIQKLPPYLEDDNGGNNTQILEKLRSLSFQKGATNFDKLDLARLASCDQETYDVVKRIVNKSANAGFSHKLINKASPNLIYVEPYMRCKTEKNHGKNINYPAIAQEKADGQFVNLKITRKGIYFVSRNGKIVQQLNHLKKHISAVVNSYEYEKYSGKVYMGELLVMKKGKILPRKTGNGIINQCMQGTASEKDAKCVIIKLWDVVPRKAFNARVCNISYTARLAKVKSFLTALDDVRFGLIHTRLVKSAKNARAFYRYMRSLGKEGAIIKNTDGIWKDHDSPDCIKMKNISDATMRVIDWKYGKEDSKYEHVMGSIKIETECGKCQVWVSGFSDKERELDWDELIGCLVDIEFEGIIESESRKDIKALYLPQYVCIREERSTADTLEDLEKR